MSRQTVLAYNREPERGLWSPSASGGRASRQEHSGRRARASTSALGSSLGPLRCPPTATRRCGGRVCGRSTHTLRAHPNRTHERGRRSRSGELRDRRHTPAHARGDSHPGCCGTSVLPPRMYLPAPCIRGKSSHYAGGGGPCTRRSPSQCRPRGHRHRGQDPLGCSALGSDWP